MKERKRCWIRLTRKQGTKGQLEEKEVQKRSASDDMFIGKGHNVHIPTNMTFVPNKNTLYSSSSSFMVQK